MESRLGAIIGVASRMRGVLYLQSIQAITNRRSFIRPRNFSDCYATISFTVRSNDPYMKQYEYLQRRYSSGTSSSSQHSQQHQQPDYWTNDGVIEGVWIFTRHGDRTPSRPLTPMHRRAEEAAFWMTKLPTPDSYAVFQAYSKYFPVSIQPPITTTGGNENTGHSHQPHVFRDVALNPFGFITSKGLQQLADNGQRFYNRYNVHGHHTPQCTLFRTPKDFLTTWDVKVYSTNYLRTVMSIQSFLDGLFHTQCYGRELTMPSENEPNHTTGDRVYDPSIIKEERIPSIAMPSHDSTWESTSETYATILVRDIHCDPLNAFDRNPTLISELVSEVMSTTDFLMRDGKAASLAARLANILPGLVRKSKKTTNDFSRHAPSRINWVEAADHFICRDAHNLSLSKFSDYEAQEEYEQTLQAMSHTTLAHLSWRFRKWYQHERLLAVIAAPPLREISNQMMQTPQLSATARRPFVLYSCHDITILGLLYAIGADFLAIDSLNDTDTLNHTSGDDTGRYVIQFCTPFCFCYC
jgi:Histidine phosphatase superfamily (branch 2)